jgi:hypothetical protein
MVVAGKHQTTPKQAGPQDGADQAAIELIARWQSFQVAANMAGLWPGDPEHHATLQNLVAGVIRQVYFERETLHARMRGAFWRALTNYGGLKYAEACMADIEQGHAVMPTQEERDRAIAAMVTNEVCTHLAPLLMQGVAQQPTPPEDDGLLRRFVQCVASGSVSVFVDEHAKEGCPSCRCGMGHGAWHTDVARWLLSRLASK